MKSNCPYCHVEFEVDDRFYGRRAECPSCGRKFIVGQAIDDSQGSACTPGKAIKKGPPPLIADLIFLSMLFFILVKVIAACSLWGYWAEFLSNHITGDDALISTANWVHFFVAVWFTKYCVLNSIGELKKIVL